MTNLEKIRAWLATYPDFDIIGTMVVDYTDNLPGGAIFPAGLLEISRWENILGNVTICNQENFGIYCTLPKSPGDDSGATYNAEWVADFQRWVQEQSARHLAPVFGNTCKGLEIIRAQNGVLYEASDEGYAVYSVQLSIEYRTRYESF